MKTTIEKITPEAASKMLAACNTRNRPLKAHHVAWLAAQMRSGHWMKNGDTITFAKDGTLIDGQHRLSAVALSQVTIECIIVRDADEDAFTTKDTGMPRSSSDVLALAGERHYCLLASTVKLLLRYNYSAKNAGRLVGSLRCTNRDVMAFVDSNQSVRESVSFAASLSTPPGFMTPTITAVVHYLGSAVDQKKTEEFLGLVISGIGLSAGDPVLVLRNRLMANKGSVAKVSRDLVLALTAKAWHLHIAGKKASCLKYAEDEASFPWIK